jgi:hypothetical protein
MRRIVLAVAVCGACGSDGAQVDAAIVGDSPPSIDAPTSDARVPTCSGVTFEMSAQIVGLSSADPDLYMRLSPDELTAYFSRQAPDELPFVATRPSVTAPFSTPVPLTITGNGTLETTSLTVTADGLTLYFTSNRTGTMGGRDIWRATRAATATAFGSITAMAALNSTGTENDVTVLPDHSAIYFSSNRSGTYRIYRASRTGTSFDPPVEVFADGAMTVQRMTVAADELTLLYAEPDDIRISTRASTSVPWLPGAAIPAIDAVGQDFPTWISTDLCRLYYSSDRSGNYDVRIAVRSPQ